MATDGVKVDVPAPGVLSLQMTSVKSWCRQHADIICAVFARDRGFESLFVDQLADQLGWLLFLLRAQSNFCGDIQGGSDTSVKDRCIHNLHEEIRFSHTCMFAP